MRFKPLILLCFALALAGCGGLHQIGGTRAAYHIDQPRAVAISEETEKTILARMGNINFLLYRYADIANPDIPRNRNLYAPDKSIDQIDFLESEYLAAVTGQLAAAACMGEQVWPQESAESLFRKVLDENTLTDIATKKKRWNAYRTPQAAKRIDQMKQTVTQIPCEMLGNMTVEEFDQLILSQYDQVARLSLRPWKAGEWPNYRDERKKVSLIADYWQTTWSGSTSPHTDDLEDKWAGIWASRLDHPNDVARMIHELRISH